MDNLTHTLTGLLLARAGLRRFYPGGTLVLLLAANTPDLDVISAAGGSTAYIHYHRWLTHSIAALPLMAVLPALAVSAFRRTTEGWKQAYALSLAGVASHILLDFTNTYGVRLLLPFSAQWFRLDITNVIDIWIWLALLIGALGPLLGRLVSSEIGARPGSGRGMAWFALGFLLFYDGARFVLHQRALAMLDARVYNGQIPLRVAALPADPINPFRWHGLAETAGFYSVSDFQVFEQFDPGAGRVIYKPEPNPAFAAARNAPSVRAFLEFVQYPLWRAVPFAPPEGATMVELRDMRFPFYTTALIGKGGTVLHDRLRLVSASPEKVEQASARQFGARRKSGVLLNLRLR